MGLSASSFSRGGETHIRAVLPEEGLLAYRSPESGFREQVSG
jgi:hypothetical protein